MNYPPCPSVHDVCCFQSEGGWSTLMSSPITYDREGRAVGGGLNKVTKVIRCNTCGKRWMATQTELERAQGVPCVWKAVDA